MNVDQANEGYRSFARGGIAAVIAINTLALGAVLSQIAELREVAEPAATMSAFTAWIAGVALGVLTWLAAAMAAQAHANGSQRREGIAAWAGYALLLASLGCFIYGAWKIADAVLVSSAG